MARFDRYEPGQFSWVDLMSKDREASRAFYGALFGWSHDDTRDDHGGVYTMFRRDGVEVAGMGEMGEEMRQAAVPSTWSSYVSVEDVAKSAEKASALGATIQLPPLAIETDGNLVGRMAILQDPEGAHISLWQPGSHVGSGIANEPGAFGWNELCSRDVPAATRFYGALFGWTFREVPGSDGYHEISLGERLNGGILPWREEMGPMPPMWSVYFNVDDCDAAVKKVQDLGGALLAGPTDIEPGRFAVVADPGGAVFNVMKMNAPDD